jgi:hypothetical protein
MRAPRRHLTTLSMIAGLATSVSGAPAQDAGQPGAGEADVQPIAPLQGPKVEDDRAPGTDSRFSLGMQRARESERPIPLRIYERELRSLESAEVEESIRLSIEQRQAIRKILQEHRRALRAFYAEHREEVAAIRAMPAPTDKPGASAEPDRAQGSARPENKGSARAGGADAKRNGPAGVRQGGGSLSPEARARMQALRAKGPQESAAISRIWDLLEEDQREHLEARFEAFRAESMRKFESQKVGDKRNAGASGAGDDSMASEQRRRARRRAGEAAAPKADD